jgi:dihydrofolate synthase/folylpolyglutamate synthase
VIEAAHAIGADLWRPGVDFSYGGDRTQWRWVGRSQRWASLAYPALRGANQLLNASGVLAAFDALRGVLPINAQAVRQGFAKVQLAGRFQIVPGQPTLVLDVAHNPHAVATLAQNLDQMGFYPRTHAVLGAMRDKDIAEMLGKMAPLVDTWHFTDLPAPRAAKAAELNAIYQAVARGAPAGATAHEHSDPVGALGAALAAADPADRIVVFGSFYTVGAVLENGLPPLAGHQPNPN